MVIQRSWKILSDAASTANNSTSETQQRSPAMHTTSSSDDSDCSNQTTHSMDTRVASPPARHMDNSSDAMPIPETPTLVFNALKGTEPTLKYTTTPDMAETMLQRIRQRYSGVHNLESGGSAESAMRALELMRISVQQSFDAEVNDLIKRYMNNYFKPAFGNIKENLGHNAVNEETLQKMSSCALLENAKAQYTNFMLRQQRILAGLPTVATEQQRIALKRPAKPGDFSNMPTSKLFINNSGAAVAAGKPCTEIGLPAQQQLQLQQQQQQHQQQQIQLLTMQQQQQQQLHLQFLSGTLPTPIRRQIFWDTAKITPTTKFVLDVQANLAFGYSLNGREFRGARLASKHPEIIRYLPDAEDRDWLLSRGVISAENRNSRFLFLLYDEICRLQQNHDLYRNRNIDLSVLLTFSVSPSMIQKMKVFFLDLNVKSRGLILNSYPLEPKEPQQQQLRTDQQKEQQQQPQQPQTQQQQPQQPQRQQQTLHLGTSIINNSHLRNALLQGVAAQQQTTNPQTTMTTMATASEEQASTSKDIPAAAASPCLQGTVVGSSTTNALKHIKLMPSSSALSTSHATLTALLNQGGATGPTTTLSNNKFRN